MLLQVTVLVVVGLLQTQAYYIGYRGTRRVGTRSLARCYTAAMPCRLKFEMSSPTMTQSSGSQQCSCNNQGRCPDSWTTSDRSKVISRDLRSENLNVTLSMRFCQSVTPAVACSPGDVSLEVSGYMVIPNELERYHCRCNDNNPLYLVERRTANNRFYHKYICSRDWNTCSSNQACMTQRTQRTSYHCKCPSHQKCQASSSWVPPNTETVVRCTNRN